MRQPALLAVLAFLTTSLLGPGSFAGCADSEGFEFEADDMAELLKAANGTFVADGPSARYRVEVVVRPAPAPRAESVWSAGSRAFACGSRTLFASASACIDLTSMPVEGSIQIQQDREQPPAAAKTEPILQGEMMVAGLRLTNARLELRSAHGSLTLHTQDARTFTASNIAVVPE